MASVWGELKRRNVVKVAVAYAIVGWVLVEITSTVLPTFEAPLWVLQTITFVIILGFPLALILSWAYEITPEGIKLERDVAAGESITHVTGRKLDFAIIGALVLALGFVVYNYVLQDGADESPEVAVVEPEQAVLPNSVAVIPFENMSVDPEEAFYAAGIHEEILNQLVKLSALNVIARTSMQQYANTEKSIPEIARELNVETVMEGSVRYSGGRIRITVQLNDGVTGAHLWSETYTLDFDDIFEIESDVAMNVANAVGAEFSLEEQLSIEEIPTDSPEAYALYLKSLTPSGGLTDLERALELDPNFALAHAQKALRHATRLSYSFDVDTVESERIALESAEKALELDPNLGIAYMALANVHEVYWRWGQAREAFELAYELSPNDPSVVNAYGRFKRSSRDYSNAIRVGARATKLDPLNTTQMNQLGIAYRYSGDSEAAAQIYRQMIVLNPMSITAHTHLGVAEATNGNYDEAVSNLRIAEERYGGSAGQVFRYAQLAMGYSMAGRRVDAERMVAILEEREEESPVGDSVWALAHIALGEYEEALERLEAAMAAPSSASYTTLIEIIANPWGDPMLDEPRFREVLRGLWSV
jgi:TolB-like protein/Tfp pilus assembly protein PilF